MEQPLSSLQVAVLAPPSMHTPVAERLARLPGVTLGHGAADVVVVVGPEGVDRLAAQEIPPAGATLVFLGSARSDDVSRASALGARVFLGLEDDDRAWELGVRAAQVGGRYWAPSLEHLGSPPGAPSAPPPAPQSEGARTAEARVRSLSNAELLAAQGGARSLSRGELAGALHLTQETVKTQLHAVYAKLGVKGKRDLPEWREYLEAEGRRRDLSWEELPERRGRNRGR